jgi:uncharacterized protein YdaU (DUF1376 family)
LNYYPFHIGDFAAHTAHLSWEEDIAYRRMLDWYYLNEKALPGDAAKVARLIRMPKSREAIDTVLAEFFVLSDDGWHNKRADQELTTMLGKQEQQSTKDAHEADRMRRYRERRALMFAALREQNVVPAWDVPMKELQRLFDAHCNAPETDLQREQAQNCNGDATAIPIPIPTPTPITVGEGGKRPARKCPVDFELTDSMRTWAKTEAPLVNVESATATFRDHTFKTAHTDWAGAWRNWLRKDQQYAAERTTNRRPTSHTGLATKDYTEGVSTDGTLV